MYARSVYLAKGRLRGAGVRGWEGFGGVQGRVAGPRAVAGGEGWGEGGCGGTGGAGCGVGAPRKGAPEAWPVLAARGNGDVRDPQDEGQRDGEQVADRVHHHGHDALPRHALRALDLVRRTGLHRGRPKLERQQQQPVHEEHNGEEGVRVHPQHLRRWQPW
jgi:hypothetical protein